MHICLFLPDSCTLTGFVHVFLFDKSLAHDNSRVNIPVIHFVKFSRRADLTFNTSAMRKKQVNRSPSIAKTCI